MAVTRQHVKGGLVGAVTAAAITIASPFIIGWEGTDLVAQHFKIDPPGVITVCNGITNYDMPDLKIGMKFTEEQCEDLLEEALPKYAATIDKCVKVEIPVKTRAALYSAAYNLGGGRICASSIVKRINAGDLQGGCDALLVYVNANGKFLQGLLNRRRAERKLCLAL